MINLSKIIKSISGHKEEGEFKGWGDRPDCLVRLVGKDILLFLGSFGGTANHYLTRLDLPAPPEKIAHHMFGALSTATDPGPGGTAGDPPYYMAAVGYTDELKFHKATSIVTVTWIKKLHRIGTNIWMPGVYLKPMKRQRRAGSAIGLGNAYNRGPIPPDDHERIGTELLELFDIIRTDFDRGPLPLRF